MAVIYSVSTTKCHADFLNPALDKTSQSEREIYNTLPCLEPSIFTGMIAMMMACAPPPEGIAL